MMTSEWRSIPRSSRIRSARSPSAAARGTTLGEVVVTARKVTENVQDVPVAITALSGVELKRASVRTIYDVQAVVPNLQLQQAVDDPQSLTFTLRGRKQNDVTLAVDPAVGLYVDGLYIPRTLGMGGSLIDLNHIEVLRGPQGTLYGGSAMGGAIKYVTREPALDKFSITAEGGVASVAHGGISYNGESFLNIPLINNQLAIRVGGAYRYDAGYIDNVFGQVTLCGDPVLGPDPNNPGQEIIVGCVHNGIHYENAKFVKKNFNDLDTYGGRAALKIDLDRVVVNGLYPERFGPRHRAALARALEAADEPVERAALRAALSEHARARAQREQVARLEEALGMEAARLPFVFEPELGPDQFEALSLELEAAL